MTAFEILLNNFYDNIERNEPKKAKLSDMENSSELFEIVRQFIETSFSHGQNLSYKTTLSELLDKTANLLQSSSHEAWSKIRSTFIENDLHIIRRDRDKDEIEKLKSRLVHAI